MICVLLTVAALLVIRLVRIKPMTTLLFSQQQDPPPKPPKSPEPSKKKPTQVTFTQELCPCTRDLQDAKVNGVPREMEVNQDVLITFFQRNGLNAWRGLGHRSEVLDPEFEAPLFFHPPIYLAGCLPSYQRSKVFLLTPREGIFVGGAVQFRIDLYNGQGQPRCTGGDEVRAWLRGQDGSSSVAAKVKDLRNGSYVGETVLPWSGVTFVHVSLTYPQEFLRMSVEMYHTFHSMRFTTETMRFGNFTERVPCLPSFPIPGYAKFCNFTDNNGGRPWYCGHPLHSHLTCHDRHVFANLFYTEPLPIPPALQRYVSQLHRCCADENDANLRLIPNTIVLNASIDVSPPPQRLPPCSSLPRVDSWDSPSPAGWFVDGKWESSACSLPEFTEDTVQSLLEFTEDTVQRCMTNTSVMLLGDSNQRMLYLALLPLLNCTFQNKAAWNAPHVCLNEHLQSSLMYAIHAMPFSPGTHGGGPVANLPLPAALDFTQKLSYPGTQDVVVVVHYFMHLSTHPLHVFRQFVRNARETVQDYLRTHPRVKFVMRGPHVTYQANNHQTQCGDKFAHWYRSIWQEEFAALRDRVWYMDIWDMTVASENVPHHPAPVMHEIARVLLGHICDGL
ncbi:hypothetical protein ACOMHN_035321 [Nucella lapillus]